MLRKKLYGPIGIFILFFIILILSYFGFAFYRDAQFNNGLKAQNEKSKLELEKAKQLLETKYKNVNMSNRDERDNFEGWSLQYDYFYYLTFSEKYLLDNRSTDFLFKLPETIGRMHALERVMNLLMTAGVRSMSDSAFELEYIEKWEKEGGRLEDDWWGKFEKSEEYHNYILKFILEKKNEKGETIEQVYQSIMDRKIASNSPLLDNVFSYSVIELERELAKEAYRNYKEHISRGEYYSAIVELNIIFEIPNDYDKIEKYNLLSYLYINTRYFQLDFIKAQLITDIFYIFFMSIVITQILYYIIRKWIAR